MIFVVILHIAICNITHMKSSNNQMKPQDVVILLKIIAIGSDHWQQKPLADSLKMSQSEISQSASRMQYAGLLLGKKVMRLAFFDFLKYGLSYVFPQKPGPVVRGIPTAHSAPPLSNKILSDEQYVWPFASGKVRGHSIAPLYSSVPDAALNDNALYELLALVDAVRVGRTREKELALKELEKRILHGK